jgi:hypothetical protein
MLIGLATLIAALFGGGGVDYFYLDKIELGVKKEIVDKDLKKDIEDDLKDFTKKVKEFRKNREGQLKELKEKNLNKSTSEEWYADFFAERMKERIEFQNITIDTRLVVQNKITDDEWAAIMNVASGAEKKEEEKVQRKEMKANDKNFFREQEKAIVENIANQEQRANILKALSIYEFVYDQIHESYEKIHSIESQFLSNRNVTKKEMLILAERMNEQRVILYKAYAIYAATTEKNTNEEDYKTIMKAFNKLLQ